MKFRDATRADFEAFFGIPPPFSMRAQVAEKDGEVVGIGGYHFDCGVAVAFTNHKPGLTRREVVLCGRRMMDMLSGLKTMVVARCDENDTALRHFGFVKWANCYRLDR